MALTKYWRWQNTGLDKILASTKSWRRQNLGVNKKLAQTYVGADTEESPYCLARQSPQLLTSPRPRWRSPTSSWWYCSLCMQSPSVVLSLAALLLWADSLLYCTGLLYRPAMLKTSQILAPTKYRRPPKIYWFSPNYSSLYICSQASYQKVVKTQSDHHHCLISVLTLMASKLEAVLEIHRYGLCALYMWGGGKERGKGGGRDYVTSLIKVNWGGGVSKQSCPSFHFPFHSFSFGLSFAYLPFCWETSLEKNWIELIRTQYTFMYSQRSDACRWKN